MKRTTCKEMREPMVEYLYEEGSAETQARIESHLETCDSCREELFSLRLARQHVQEGRVLAEETEAPRVIVVGHLGGSRRRRWPALAMAAVLALMASLALVNARMEWGPSGPSLSFGFLPAREGLSAEDHQRIGNETVAAARQVRMDTTTQALLD